MQRAVVLQARCRYPGRAMPRGVGEVLLLDASLIDLYRHLHPWAEFRKGTSAAKLHLTYLLKQDIPEVSVITPGLRHDLPIAKRHIPFAPGTTVVFDRGYWSVAYLERLHDGGVGFVTRARRNNRFEVRESFLTSSPGVLDDERVRQKGDGCTRQDRRNPRDSVCPVGLQRAAGSNGSAEIRTSRG